MLLLVMFTSNNNNNNSNNNNKGNGDKIIQWILCEHVPKLVETSHEIRYHIMESTSANRQNHS